jgi:hypothetical protein
LGLAAFATAAYATKSEGTEPSEMPMPSLKFMSPQAMQKQDKLFDGFK